MSDAVPTTDPGLLFALAQEPQDAEAWVAFELRYRPVLLRWGRRQGLQEADAEDVAQEILTRLVKTLRSSFTYDPRRSFRAYLRTAVAHAVADFWQARARSPQATGGEGAVDALLKALPDAAAEELSAHLSDQLEGEDALVRKATALVQGRVQPQTWEAFQLQAVDGLTAEEAAQRLQVSTAAVLKAKSRVARMLRETLLALRGQSTLAEEGTP